MSNKNRTNNNSLCEKSMKMMVNIIRLSSFSIAKMSLGTPKSSSVPTTARSLSSVVGDEEPLLPQIPGGIRRSQEPSGSSRPLKVVMPPAGGDEDNKTSSSSSTYVVHHQEKKSGVDGWADDYIRKVHEKNRKNANETSSLDVFIMPPPPRVVK